MKNSFLPDETGGRAANLGRKIEATINKHYLTKKPRQEETGDITPSYPDLKRQKKNVTSGKLESQ